VIRYLLSATFLLLALRLFALAKQTDDLWFYVASSAFALASIGNTCQILLTYKGTKRQ
jgi:hypothetical protein